MEISTKSDMLGYSAIHIHTSPYCTLQGQEEKETGSGRGSVQDSWRAGGTGVLWDDESGQETGHRGHFWGGGQRARWWCRIRVGIQVFYQYLSFNNNAKWLSALTLSLSLRNWHLSFHRHSGHGSSHLHGPPSIFKAQVLQKKIFFMSYVSVSFHFLIYREGGFYCGKKIVHCILES